MLFPSKYAVEFQHYIYYCWLTPFEALPDYEFLKELFQKVLEKCETPDDFGFEEFDWIVKRQNLIAR
jgi:hypothetical protein